jgi:hypothetical protein
VPTARFRPGAPAIGPEAGDTALHDAALLTESVKFLTNLIPDSVNLRKTKHRVTDLPLVSSLLTPNPESLPFPQERVRRRRYLLATLVRGAVSLPRCEYFVRTRQYAGVTVTLVLSLQKNVDGNHSCMSRAPEIYSVWHCGPVVYGAALKCGGVPSMQCSIT